MFNNCIKSSHATGVDLPSGQIRDKVTGLIWQTTSQATGNWSSALTNAVGQSGNGWRLPNIKELMSVVDTGCESPAWNSSVFGDTVGVYWTSSYDINNPNNTWAVDFSSGELISIAQATENVKSLLVKN